jgi:hypothetical protein
VCDQRIHDHIDLLRTGSQEIQRKQRIGATHQNDGQNQVEHTGFMPVEKDALMVTVTPTLAPPGTEAAVGK